MNVGSVEFEELRTATSAGHLLSKMSSGVTILRGAMSQSSSSVLLGAMRRLFGKSQDEKNRYHSQRAVSPGYEPYGVARAIDTAIPNLLESWTVSPTSLAKFPNDSRDDWYDLADVCRTLNSTGSLALAALDWGLDVGGLLIRSACPNISDLRLINYPAHLIKDIPQGARRQSIHVDSSILTLLPHASERGLRVEIDGQFVTLSTMPGDVVLMAGSLLEFLTDGRILASRHTVGFNEGPNERIADRLSAVYMIDPAPTKYLHRVCGRPETISVVEHQSEYTSSFSPSGAND